MVRVIDKAMTTAIKISSDGNINTDWFVKGCMLRNDNTLVVSVNCVDTLCDANVYNITAYCLATKVKVQYQRVKAYKNLLTDEKAVSIYFANGGEMCKFMADARLKKERRMHSN